MRTGDQLTLSERAADAARNGMGSWAFITIQTVIVAAWIALNIIGVVDQWDPYPFILLNLAFSTQAAYAAPLILLAQRRQDQQASELAQHDFQVNQEALRKISDTLANVLSTLDAVGRIEGALSEDTTRSLVAAIARAHGITPPGQAWDRPEPPAV